MGVRLYPVTEDPAVLEQLCCVPPGTAARLAKLASRPEFQPLPGDDFHARDAKHGLLYDAVQLDHDLAAYSQFSQDGWGKLHDGAREAIEAWCRALGKEVDYNVGECLDLAVCAAVLREQSRKSSAARSWLLDRDAEAGPAALAALAGGLVWS